MHAVYEKLCASSNNIIKVIMITMIMTIITIIFTLIILKFNNNVVDVCLS